MTNDTDDKFEAENGYRWVNGIKTYCCYGTYLDIGHSSNCRHRCHVTEELSTMLPPMGSLGEEIHN